MDFANIQTWITVAGGISLALGITLSARYRYIKQLDNDTIASLEKRLAVEETKSGQLEEQLKAKDSHIAELSKIAQQTPEVANLTKQVAELTLRMADKVKK